MKTGLLLVTFFTLSAGWYFAKHREGRIIKEPDPDQHQLCSSFLVSHHSILESIFEQELYVAAYRTDEWHEALDELEVATRDPGGHAPNPSSVLQSTIHKLVQVRNNADRLRLEYLLMGGRLSLGERRQFDAYCTRRPE